jgi:hypothetical protein
MLLAATFGVYFVLLGVVAWQDFRLDYSKFRFKA